MALHISHVGYVMPMLDGRTGGFVAILAISGLTLTVRACPQTCMLNKSSGKNVVWKCGMPNFSTSLFDTTASLETHNRFDSLSSLSDPESPIPDIIPLPPPPPPLQLHPL